MAKRSAAIRDYTDAATPDDLSISAEKLAHIIVKAREFDAKEAVVEPDPGSNPEDDKAAESLEDYPDDPTSQELADAIEGLNEDEAIDVIAIAWIGRGDFEATEWTAARALARERHRGSLAVYLMGMPQLGDYLEEGYAALGGSIDDIENGRL